MPAPPIHNQSGFTLIEVVIVLVILTFISLGIYQMTTSTYRLRDELSNEGEFYNSIRMSMDVMQGDVMAMFSPTITRPNPNPSASPTPNAAPAPADAQDLQNLASSDQGHTSTFWLGATEKSGLRASRFIGTDSKISFVSSSHIRIYKDSPESYFAKVTYELVRDEDKPDSMVLVKTESPDVFDNDDRRDEQKYAHKYFLLHGVKSLKFRYWRKDKDNGLGKWETGWDTDKEDYKEKYPDIVEVSIEVNGPDKLSYTGIYKLRPEVPLRGLDPSS